MIRFLRGLFRVNPVHKIRRTRDRKYKEAVEFQRNGNLRAYAKIMKEIEDLEDEYDRVNNESR